MSPFVAEKVRFIDEEPKIFDYEPFDWSEFDEEVIYGPLPAYDYEAELAMVNDEYKQIIVKVSACPGMELKSILKSGTVVGTSVSPYSEDRPHKASLNFKTGCSSTFESVGGGGGSLISSPISDSLDVVVVGGPPKRVRVGASFFE